MSKVITETRGGKQVPAVQIEEGDTTWSIAKEHLGDVHRWIDIVKFNPEIFARMQLVKPGDIVRLPDDGPVPSAL